MELKKKKLAYFYTRVLLSNKKQCTDKTHNNIDEFQNHFEGKKPDTKEPILMILCICISPSGKTEAR